MAGHGDAPQVPAPGVVVNTFNRHDFAFCWSYTEMAPLITGLGYDWAIEQTAKCIAELIDLTRPDIDVKKALKSGDHGGGLFAGYTPPPVTVTCQSADNLDYLDDASVDVVVMDPPYYDNVQRGQPRTQPAARRRRQEVVEDDWDPYAATPEDALEAARREVKRWRLEQLVNVQRQADLDPLTEWFVLAWDAFQAPQFPYDEALRLARVVGVDLDQDIVGRIAEKKSSDLILWDSAIRAAKGALGPADGSRAMLDALHQAAHLARSRTLDAAREFLANAGVDQEPAFLAALEAVLEVLPPSARFTGITLAPGAEAAGSDFEALESLRRLAFAEKVDEPQQLALWKEEVA